MWIRIRTFLDLPDLDPSSSVWIRIWILPYQAKIVRKTFNSTVLRLLYDLLSLKTDVNVTSKSNQQKKTFCWHLEGRGGRKVRLIDIPIPIRSSDCIGRYNRLMSSSDFCIGRRCRFVLSSDSLIVRSCFLVLSSDFCIANVPDSFK
jgi:hypothetical protein